MPPGLMAIASVPCVRRATSAAICAGGTGAPVVVKMDLLSCAYRICDSIACAFRQQAGIAVNCEVIQINKQLVKLVLSLPNGHIDWGNFNVCVSPATAPGPVMVPIHQPAIDPFNLTICWPFTATGYCLQCVDVLGQPLDWAPSPAALHGSGTQLKVVVPIDRVKRFYRLYRPPPLLTNPD